MYEFFSVVDELHDDPTIFPVLSGPQEVLPFEWEDSDADSESTSFATRRVTIHQHSGRGWTKTRGFTDLDFIVLVTGGRVVVYCEKFIKGGGWRGLGVGGLAFAAVANAVSHARAAARRKGKLFVAQVRYPWLSQVCVIADRKGHWRTLRLVVNAGADQEPRWLALDLDVGRNQDAAALAEWIAGQAARSRLLRGPAVAPDERSAWQSLAADPAGEGSDWAWALPSSICVGQAGSIPSEPLETPTPEPDQPTAPPAPVPEAAQESETEPQSEPEPDPEETRARRVTDVDPALCTRCGHRAIAAVPSCSHCGAAFGSESLEATGSNS